MQATYLDELYEDFLFSIKDYTYLNADVTNEDIEQDLYIYLKKAKGKFHKCRNRLDILEDELGRKFFGYIEQETIKVPIVKDEPKEEDTTVEDTTVEDTTVTTEDGEAVEGDVSEDVSQDETQGEGEGEGLQDEEIEYTEEIVEVVKGVTLTDMEKGILTHLMIVEHLKPQVLSSEVLRPSLSDKSFKIYSQANHLRELNLLYRLFQKESNKMITEYTYLDLEEGK